MRSSLLILSFLIFPLISLSAQETNYYNGSFMGLNIGSDGSVTMNLSSLGKYIKDFVDSRSVDSFVQLSKALNTVSSEFDKMTYLIDDEPNSVEIKEDPSGIYITYRNNKNQHKYFIDRDILKMVEGDYLTYIDEQKDFFDELYLIVKEISPSDSEIMQKLKMFENMGLYDEVNKVFGTQKALDNIGKLNDKYFTPYFTVGNWHPLVVINNFRRTPFTPTVLTRESDVISAVNVFLPNIYRNEELEAVLDNLLKYMITEPGNVDLYEAKLLIFGDPDLSGSNGVIEYLLRFKSSDQHMLAIAQLFVWLGYSYGWDSERYVSLTMSRALFYNGILGRIMNLPEKISEIEADIGYKLPNKSMVELGIAKYTVSVKR